MLLILLALLALVLAVDFGSGLLHWAEDTFGSESTPLLGRWIVRANVQHHEDGAAFVRFSYWRSNWDLLLLGALGVVVARWFDRLTWQVWVLALVGGNSNQVHKWAHMPRRERPAPVRWLQSLHVLQTPAHHAGHHGGPRTTRYCVMTELLNPVLDGLGFWRGLERVLATPRNSPRRVDLWGERRAA